MELRKGMKFNNDDGDIIELDYCQYEHNGDITWWDTNDNDWVPYYLIQELKNGNYELRSYPYKVGDYVVITKYQNGSELGSVVELTTICSHSVYYADIDNHPGLRFEANVNYIRPAFQNEINNIKNKKMKETQFKVGDWVKITKSDSNWNSQMDKFDRQIVQITSITSDDTIRFENDGTWQWEYKNNHFVKADSPTRLLSPEEQEYLLVGYSTVPINLSTVPPIRTISESFKFDDYSIHFSGTLNQENSSSPTISIIKPKNKKSMFKSDIVSFK